MTIRLALAGNPNCGKTTLFNALTGASQYVGNWPGVTVEKKEGRLKGDREVTVVDLPGIYSLSPYTLEEVITRSYILKERPDVVINLVDGSNIERNLYLTTQLTEMGIPVVIALNMMDIVEKRGDQIDAAKLSGELGCPVVKIAAISSQNVDALVQQAVELARGRERTTPRHTFANRVEQALGEIAGLIQGAVPEENLRWYAIKLFERDEKAAAQLKLSPDVLNRVEETVAACEAELDDDSESIITNERYAYIGTVAARCVKKQRRGMSTSDRIDRIVTNRILALPIFVAVMFLVYYLSVSTIGSIGTDWANDGVFGDGWHLFGIGTGAYEEAAERYEAAVEETLKANGLEFSYQLEEAGIDVEAATGVAEPDPADYGVWVPGIPVLVESGLDAVGCGDTLKSLILDGIVAGVGAVLGFLPQMLVLFLLLAVLEDCGYMARVAFIMDRIFRRFGLSGKSFIPFMVATGCGIPGVMASRTIENEADRKVTIMTTTFMPCGAKLPVIAMFAGAVFGDAWWVAASAYFMGIAAIICSAIILKKFRRFAGDPAPFVMELPNYHAPRPKGVLIHMWDRAKSFVKKAGTIILLATILVWFLSSFGWEGGFGMVEDQDNSILAMLGSALAILFAPLGFGNWRAAAAVVTGLIAKENVVSTFGVLYGHLAEVGENGEEIWAAVQAAYPPLAAYSFMAFNLLCAPCFAAMGAIRREMGSWKGMFMAIGWQCGLAYAVSLCIYQLGSMVTGNGNVIGLIAALTVVVGFVYLLVRRAPASAGRERLSPAAVSV